MSALVRLLLATLVVLVVGVGIMAVLRITRIAKAAAAIPLYRGAREGGGRTRYFPHLISWDDRSSARVQRVFALPESISLRTVATAANASLEQRGWYLVAPDHLEQFENPDVVIWQRDPDERLDLSVMWPVRGISREQRLYGGVFPPEFLDSPLVIEWSWSLGGPRLSRPVPIPGPSIRIVPPPRPR